MTLVLRTTDHPQSRHPSLPAAPRRQRPAAATPVRDAAAQRPRRDALPRPPAANWPCAGIPVMCSACRARRDWLLINHGRNVWVRCRCSNQWLEPEISRADFDALIAIPDGTTYPSVEQGLAALGFDGAFAGIYLE